MSTTLFYEAHGATGFTCQLPRIIEGLKTLDWFSVAPSADYAKPLFIYSNDSGGYDAAIAAKKASPSSKLILNVLDICEHCFPNFDLFGLELKLKKADAITCISPYVASQLQRYLGLYATVIWNPIKPVNGLTRRKGVVPYPQFKAAMIGRLNDPGKRASLGIQGLIHAGYGEDEVAMIGSEYPNWGTRMGVISDEVLSDILCSVDFVVMPSLFEGLGLPALEGMVCGAIPIICHDLTTFHDLHYPQYWGCYPSHLSIAHRLRTLRSNPTLLKEEKELALGIGRDIVELMSGEAVARNIVKVYQSLL